MGAIEDVRNLMQDIVAPDIKAIKAQLNALEKTVNSNHTDVMAAIGRIVDYKDVIQRLNKLEERLPKQ